MTENSLKIENSYPNSLKIVNWKLKIALTIVFFFLPTIVSAATLQKPPNNLGLVGYWAFNENTGSSVGDFSGNGNTGSITGASWVTGKSGGALSFASTNRVNVGSNSSIDNIPNAGTFTVTTWLYRTGNGANQSIFTMDGTTFGTRAGVTFTADNSPGEGTVRVIVRKGNPVSGDTDYVSSAGVVPLNKWTFVAATFDNAGSANEVINIYTASLDSPLAEVSYNSRADTAGTPTLDAANDKWIGNIERANTNPFLGRIDEVRYYNRVLSVSELTNLSQTGAIKFKVPNNLGLVGYWSFNEGTSTIATDFSGNGNNGTLNSFANPPTATSGWGNGKMGKALNFDGTDDRVTHTLDLLKTQGTVAHWVRPRVLRAMVAYYESDGVSASTYNGFASTGDVLEMNTGISVSGNTWNVTYQDGTAASGSVQVDAGTPVLGKWSYVVTTWNRSGSLRLYVDGVEVGSTDMSAKSFTSKTPSVRQIGRVGDGTSARHWSGEIDEVRVYNRALSADEVAGLYQGSKVRFINSSQNTRITDGLVGMWSFNGADINWTSATAGTAYDRSGLSNNGTFSGMSQSTSPSAGKVGQALDFNGSSGYVSLGTDAIGADLNGAGGITVSHWINFDSVEAQQDGSQLVSIIRNTSTNGFFSNVRGDVGNVNKVQIGGRSDGADTLKRKTSTTVLSPGTWYHVVGVLDFPNDRMNIYINGVSEGWSSATFASDTYVQGTPTSGDRIGDYVGSDKWDGRIDEVRIYSRVLSDTEIKQLYLMGK